MTINQRIELSREIRQWISIALSIGVCGAFVYAYVNEVRELREDQPKKQFKFKKAKAANTRKE